jgi:tRNA1Val (adenine37-N6)-methyltransferase
MPNPYFRFKQFTVMQDKAAMKVTTDACLFGAWCAAEIAAIQPPPRQLLDAGTGTGLLSLLVAQKNTVLIDAVEIEAEAAQQAAQNIGASPWKESITVINSDVLDLPPQKKYDCIISNPPFYEADLRSPQAAKNKAHHDTALTLSKLFSFIAQQLLPNGSFFLLLPYKRVREWEKDLKEHGLFCIKKTEVIQSVRHQQPFRVMLRGAATEAEPATERLVIRDETEQYTPAFAALLRDYYLYL